MGTAEDQNSMFSRLAGRVSKGGNFVSELVFHTFFIFKRRNFVNHIVFISFLNRYSYLNCRMLKQNDFPHRSLFLKNFDSYLYLNFTFRVSIKQMMIST